MELWGAADDDMLDRPCAPADAPRTARFRTTLSMVVTLATIFALATPSTAALAGEKPEQGHVVIGGVVMPVSGPDGIDIVARVRDWREARRAKKKQPPAAEKAPAQSVPGPAADTRGCEPSRARRAPPERGSAAEAGYSCHHDCRSRSCQ